MENESLQSRIDNCLPNLTPSERHELDNGAAWHERNGQLGLLAKCGWFTPVEAMKFKRSSEKMEFVTFDFSDEWWETSFEEVFGKQTEQDK